MAPNFVVLLQPQRIGTEAPKAAWNPEGTVLTIGSTTVIFTPGKDGRTRLAVQDGATLTALPE